MRKIISALLAPLLLGAAANSNPAYVELGEPHTQTDWATYLENTVFPRLPKSGSGGHVGVVVVNGMLPLTRTVTVPRHVTLVGKWRPGWHPSGSCGFAASPDFNGDVLLTWDQGSLRDRPVWYSNFGAGMKDLFLSCKPGVGGAKFIGAQQSSTVDTVIIRGFGNAIGLQLAGDTYEVRRVLVDPLTSGSGTVPGSVGIASFGSRLVHLLFSGITAHNCAVGIRIGDGRGIVSVNYETETTPVPLQFTYQMRDSQFINSRHLHTDVVAEITRARFPGAYGLRLQGHMLTSGPRIIRPDKPDLMVTPSFDVASPLAD